MCEHDWEVISRVADGNGDVYEYHLCTFCGEEKESIINDIGI